MVHTIPTINTSRVSLRGMRPEHFPRFADIWAKPEVVAQGSLQYRVEGMVFHMSGDWVIMVDVARDGKTERAAFPVSVE